MTDKVNAGIDYGHGKANIDLATDIRYGVISLNSIPCECQDDFKDEYGKPICPECGGDLVEISDKDTLIEWPNTSEYGENDYACERCKHWIDSEECFPEERQGFSHDRDGYIIVNCLDNDAMIIKSPFYTYAQLCSPCVPGAGDLDNPRENGVKTYCLGPEWFDGGISPYLVYRVSDDGLEVEQTNVE